MTINWKKKCLELENSIETSVLTANIIVHFENPGNSIVYESFFMKTKNLKLSQYEF